VLDDVLIRVVHPAPAYVGVSEPSQPVSSRNTSRKIHSVTVVCDGLLVESEDGIGKCDQGDSCQALGLQDDYPAYRAAHGRVIAKGQDANGEEYGGEG